MIRITIEQSEAWPHENNSSRTKETKLYEQSVETLDIPAVIAVVNGMQKLSPISSETKRCESRDQMGMQCWMWCGHPSDHFFKTVSLDRSEMIEDVRALAEWRRNRSVARRVAVKHERVVDDVVAFHGSEYIEVRNAHAFVGVAEVMLRIPPHFDACARLSIDPVTPELEKNNWLKVGGMVKILNPQEYVGMRVEALSWIIEA